MEWIVGIGIGIGIFLFGAWSGIRLSINDLKNIAEDDPRILEHHRVHGIDRCHLLESYRSPYADYLILRDPQKYLELYKEIVAELSKLDEYSEKELGKELNLIVEKYPDISNFGCSCNDWVLSYDNFQDQQLAEIEKVYFDNAKFQHIRFLTDRPSGLAFWLEFPRSDEDISYLEEYVSRVNDTLLLQRLELADNEYRNFASIIYDKLDFLEEVEELHTDDDRLYDAVAQKLLTFSEERKGLEYENSWFSVSREIGISSPATRYFFHLKNTDDFGIVEHFTSDEGESYVSFYRSDKDFIDSFRLNEIPLGNQLIIPKPYKTNSKT